MNLYKNVKQNFDVLTRERHLGEPVLLRVTTTLITGEEQTAWTDEYQAKIDDLRSNGKIVLRLHSDALLEVEREMIKLKR